MTHEIVGEGRNLLNPTDDNVRDTPVLTLLEESVVNLTYGPYPRLAHDTTNDGMIWYAPVQRM